LDRPHIITHLFADGGRIIKSNKRSYATEVKRDDVAAYVRQLMKGQHMEMAILLREGKFDEVIAGRAVGGMHLLEEPPRIEIQKLATKTETRVEAPLASRTSRPPAAHAEVGSKRAASTTKPETLAKARFRLVVQRAPAGAPAMYEPLGDTVVLGSAGDLAMVHERFCSPREAEIRWEKGRIWVRGLPQGNGVFLRVRQAVELEIGDEFVVGDQLLTIERNPDPNDGPGDGPTYFYSSPKWTSSFRVVQLFEGGAKGACAMAQGTTMQIGSAIGDVVFTADPLVDDQHCLVEEQAGAILLTDLDSRTGVFVRVKGDQELVQGDEVMVGRTRMQLEIVSS
jgi:pSer/pThr/pTyr-binding forkhead associated (FHA) protein